MTYDGINYCMELTLTYRPLFPVGDFGLKIYHYFGDGLLM